jgi:hypothetical protein
MYSSTHEELLIVEVMTEALVVGLLTGELPVEAPGVEELVVAPGRVAT